MTGSVTSPHALTCQIGLSTVLHHNGLVLRQLHRQHIVASAKCGGTEHHLYAHVLAEREAASIFETFYLHAYLASKNKHKRSTYDKRASLLFIILGSLLQAITSHL